MKKLVVLLVLSVYWLFSASASFTTSTREESGKQVLQASTPTVTATTRPKPSITPTFVRRPLLPDEVDGLWSKPVDVTQGVNRNWHAYPIGICDQYQNLHIFWADNYSSKAEKGDPTAALFYRNDISGTLSPPKDVFLTGDQNIHFPEVAISKVDDTFHFTWVNTPNGILYYTSVPIAAAGNSKAWTQQTPIDYQVFNGSIFTDKEGTVHLFYGRRADDDGLENEVIHISLKHGQTDWSSPEIIFSRKFDRPSQIRTEAAIDGTGRFHVGITLRSVEYGAASEVGYLRSTDGGKTWTYKKFEDTGKTFQGVEWIAPYTFGNDEIHLTWHDPERMHTWSTDGGLTWTDPTVMIRLGGAFGGSNDLVKDSAGTLRVIVAVQGGVYSAVWDPATDVWGPAELIDGREIDNHGQRLIVCQGNQLHVLFYDRTGDTTSWYSTRSVSAPAIARKPLPTLPVTATVPPPSATPQASNAESTATMPVIDPALINKTPPGQVSPMTPILTSAIIAVIFFFIVAGIVQFLRMRA
jgi:hypothetical protein